MNREAQLAGAFVDLADCLAEDVDPVILLERLARHSVEIVGADAVGVMMANSRGELRTMAVTDDTAALVELFQLHTDEGPCLDCFRGGHPVDAPDLRAEGDRWPKWAPLAERCGYRAAHALPLRVDRRPIGSVNLLLGRPKPLPDTHLGLAQALADVAALALVHWDPDRLRPTDIHTRTQAAVATKAVVEVASGMLAESCGLTMTEAHSALRAYAAHQGCGLVSTAHEIMRRTLPPASVLDPLRRT